MFEHGHRMREFFILYHGHSNAVSNPLAASCFSAAYVYDGPNSCMDRGAQLVGESTPSCMVGRCDVFACATDYYAGLVGRWNG